MENTFEILLPSHLRISSWLLAPFSLNLFLVQVSYVLIHNYLIFLKVYIEDGPSLPLGEQLCWMGKLQIFHPFLILCDIIYNVCGANLN